MKNIPFLGEIMGSLLWKICKNATSEVHISIGWKRFFSIEKIPKHYFKIIFAQKQEMKSFIF